MKVAVVTIGINYIGQDSELQGCINDSHNFLAWARGYYGANLRQIVQMTDDLPSRHKLFPSRGNIERVLTNMRKRCKRNNFTHFLLHYSGHGGQIRDKSGDEVDGLDEALIPVDYASNGLITDDWMLNAFVQKIHSKVKFFGLLDACHSGTMLDLRYRNASLINRSASEVGNAMMISGSADNEYSYDTWDATYGRCGAMTAAFLRTAQTYGVEIPAQQFVNIMRTDLDERGYPQTPQLSTSKPVTESDALFLI